MPIRTYKKLKRLYNILLKKNLEMSFQHGPEHENISLISETVTMAPRRECFFISRNIKIADLQFRLSSLYFYMAFLGIKSK